MGIKAIVLAALLALALPGAASAQTPKGVPTPIRGTVESLHGHTLKLQSRDRRHLTVTLAPDFTVNGVAKRTLADVKVGDYVASTSVRGKDGELHAVEVHIFPEAMRGIAEGQFPWNLVPDSLMTNATVERVTATSRGRILVVNYKGHTAQIVVGRHVPIVALVPGGPRLLKRGAAIFTVAFTKPDGSLTAAHVTAEKDGVKPPM